MTGYNIMTTLFLVTVCASLFPSHAHFPIGRQLYIKRYLRQQDRLTSKKLEEQGKELSRYHENPPPIPIKGLPSTYKSWRRQEVFFTRQKWQKPREKEGCNTKACDVISLSLCKVIYSKLSKTPPNGIEKAIKYLEPPPHLVIKTLRLSIILSPSFVYTSAGYHSIEPFDYAVLCLIM